MGCEHLVYYAVADSYQIPVGFKIEDYKSLLSVELTGPQPISLPPLRRLVLRFDSSEEFAKMRTTFETALNVHDPQTLGDVVQARSPEKNQGLMERVGVYLGYLGYVVAFLTYWVSFFGWPTIDVHPDATKLIVAEGQEFDAKFVVLGRQTYGDTRVDLTPVTDGGKVAMPPPTSSTNSTPAAPAGSTVTVLSREDEIPAPILEPGKIETISIHCQANKPGSCVLKVRVHHSLGAIWFLGSTLDDPATEPGQAIEVWPAFDHHPKFTFHPDYTVKPPNPGDPVSVHVFVTLDNGQAWESGGSYEAYFTGGEPMDSLCFIGKVTPEGNSAPVKNSETVLPNNTVMTWITDKLPAAKEEKYSFMLTAPTATADKINWADVKKRLIILGGQVTPGNPAP